ncbi:MAG: hypothetical protein K0S97_1319 [Chloroflexota bacterium]|jgi:hypothetical protein|nr:hypothetical protein [Chloroflexota bacterium]
MRGKAASEGHEREIPAPKPDPGMLETDDHVMGRAPRSDTQRGDIQPTVDLDPSVDDEHLRSPSQGVRPDR